MLARLLSPAEFGVVGAALIVISFTELFSEAGVPATLIQKRELSEVDIRVALLVSLLIAWTLYALVTGSAPFAATFMHIPAVANVIPVLALVLPMMGFNGISGALMQRQHRVTALTMFQVASHSSSSPGKYSTLTCARWATFARC